jgi:hypothetical protein
LRPSTGCVATNNLSVSRQARQSFHGMTAAQLVASRVWEELVKNRWPRLAEMTHAQRALFKHEMNTILPQRRGR